MANKMIRPATPNDISELLDIWLMASIKAHNFVGEQVWLSQVEADATGGMSLGGGVSAGNTVGYTFNFEA